MCYRLLKSIVALGIPDKVVGNKKISIVSQRISAYKTYYTSIPVMRKFEL